MASFDELRQVRVDKLKILESAAMSAYPAETAKEFTNAEAVEKFDDLSTKTQVTLAGRVMSLRPQGAMYFFHVNDGTASFQGLMKNDEVSAETFDLFGQTVDIGDFVEMTGPLFVTKRGEKTVAVKSWKMLAKSLRPLPEKYHGIQDEEEKFRRRYLDIMFNPEVKEMFVKRSKFWNTIRTFLLERGYLEVETPIIENMTGGAEAKPFLTHHNALNQDVFLRISPELWLKRLMIAGYPKVFEIGRVFRNEGMDAEHAQDYTHFEFYEAYSDYQKGMKMVEELYKVIADKVFGTRQFKIKDFNIDLDQKWELFDYPAIIKDKTGIDIKKVDLKTAEMKLRDLKVEYDSKGLNLNRAIDNLWKYCRKQIAGPGFLVNVPVTIEPLAKRNPADPDTVERFQVILAGSEMGKGFSELNDPIDQAGRFADQAKLREGGDDEAQMNDTDYVEAMEYGMPPTFGFGVSERLFSFFMDKPIRETQIFPLMRPKK